MNVTITLGGLFIGLVLILRQFLPDAWGAVMKGGGGAAQPGVASGKFTLRAHAPFLIGTTVGMLAISCPGGLIGTLAAKAVGISNTVGDKVVSGGVGAAATSVTRHAATAVTPFGGLITVLAVVAVIILRKTLDKRAKGQMFSGVWAGSTLGLSAGAAGITATVLIPLVNQAGALIGGQL
ncbi:hypothetical protein ACPC54_23605 [Kitasatospora sp. NPDC094028]